MNRRDYGAGSIYQRKDGKWIGTIEAGYTATGARRRITVAGKTHDPAGLAFVFPAAGRIAAAIVTTPGDEWLVYRFQPFRSAFVPPDYMIWSKAGLLDSGFFTPDWKAVETP